MSAINHSTSVATPAIEELTALKVSVVIPCLNEADNIEACVRKAHAVLDEHGISGEVVVADNDSDDGSPELAAAAGRESCMSRAGDTAAPTWPDWRRRRASTSSWRTPT